MDEEEYQRIVNGAAGATGVPIYKKYWSNPNFPEPGDITEGMPPLFNLIDDNYYRVDEQGNPVEGFFDWYKHGVSGGDWRLREYENMTPFQRWSYNQGYRFAQDPTGEMIDWSIPFLTLLQDKIPGLSSLIPDLSTAEDYKYDVPVEDIEIPEYTPWEMKEEYKPPLTPREYFKEQEGYQGSYPGDPYTGAYNLLIENPLAGTAGSTSSGNRDPSKVRSDYQGALNLYDMGLWNRTFPGSEPAPSGEDWEPWFNKQFADIDEQLQAEYEEELRKSREDFDRRNEEEERRHREEYNKMVEDMMDTSFSTEGVGEPILPPMDTDFSMGDLEQGTFEEIRDVINDFFKGQDSEPQISPPPQWLSVD